MKTSTKHRILSLVLTLCLFGTLLSGISLTAAAAGFTVTFSVPDGLTAPDPLTGTSITLPSAATPNGKYRFAGWSETQGSVDASAVLTGPYAPTANKTLYAVYSLSSGTDGYVKVTSDPGTWDGRYLIVYEASNYAFNANKGTSATALNVANNYLPVTISSNVIAASDDLDNASVKIAKVSSGNYTIYLPCNKYLGFTGSSTSGMNVNANTAYEHTISFNNGIVTIQNASGTNIRTFVYNSASNSNKFAYYNKDSNVSLYKKNTAGVTYTTAPEVCTHANATFVVTDPTCTEPGFTTYTCPSCTLSWTEAPTEALGHDFVAGDPVAATADHYGYTPYTCSLCGETEERDKVGLEYQVTLSILGTAQAAQTVDSYNGIELPTAEDEAVPEIDNYTFAGWTEAAADTPSANAVIYSGTYYPSADVTLYAAYYYTEANEGSGDYVKVLTGTPIVSDGTYLFVCEDWNGSAVAFKGVAADDPEYDPEVKGNYMLVTIADSEIAATTEIDAAAVTIHPFIGTDKYYMTLSNGKYVGHTGTGSSLNTKTREPAYEVTAAVVNTEDENGNPDKYNVAWIADGEFVLRLNTTTAGSEKIAFYKAATAKYLPMALYYKDGSGVTTYYTTSPVNCEHTNAASEHIVATCTEAGYNAFTCPDCGFEWTEEIKEEPKLGHTFENAEATCNDDGTHTRICDRCNEAITENCKYDKDTHLCSVCSYPQPAVIVTYDAAGTITEETVYGSTTLPATAEAVDGYNFVGWSETPINEEVTELPETRKGTFSPKEDTTLYAVYVRSEIIGPGTGTGDYIKITSNADLTEGKYLVVYEAGAYAFNGALDKSDIIDKSGNYLVVTPNNGTIASDYYIDNAALTITPAEGAFTVQTASGKYIGNTGSNSAGGSISINTKPYYNDISVDDGVASITNASGVTYTLLFNTYSTSDRFGFFAEGKNTRSVSLYKKDGTGPEVAYYYVTNLATELKIKSASLRLDEDIDVIYKATVPAGYTDVSMTFTMNGETVTIPDDGTHTFVFEGVNPQCIGDNISATLTATYDDEQLSDELAEYSVRTYCVNKLADETISASLRTLLSDVLAYGAAAQTYMSYKTNALVNADVTGTNYSTYTDLSGLKPTFTGTVANDIYWTAAGLTLTDSVAMRFRFYAENTAGLSVKVSINGRTQTFTEFTAVDGKDNVYEVVFRGIKADEFDKAVTASFNNGQVGNTVSYSVNAYICAKQADSNANLAALVKALYNYGAAAAAYK